MPSPSCEHCTSSDVSTTIRLYRATDRAALLRTAIVAGDDSPTGTLWGHAASELDVYLTAYIDHDPSSLLVAELDGRIIGYLTGCLNTADFPSESERIDAALRAHRLYLEPQAVRFFALAAWDSIVARTRRPATATGFDDSQWPSHLHINVVRDARNRGVGELLMREWFTIMNRANSPGCHLNTLVENTDAIRFFSRHGFSPHGQPALVPGIRHDGARTHQLTMIRTPTRS